MTHCVASDFGRAHRDRIYTAHCLSERLSLVCAERGGAVGGGVLLAVNLYRHRNQPRFDTPELDTASTSPLRSSLKRRVRRQGRR